MLLHLQKGFLSHPFFRWLPAVLIFMVGLTFSALASYEVLQKNTQRVHSQLTALAQRLKNEIHTSVNLYQYGLRGLRGTFAVAGTSENLSYDLHKKYTYSRDYSKEFPGARGIGFIQYVRQHELDTFLTEAAKDRPDGTFRLRQLNTHQNDLFIIRYIEPENLNQQAIGLDIGSESNRRQAALTAAESAAVSLTAPITLVQAENKVSQGFLMLLPFYTDGIVPDTKALRMAHLEGWTYAPLLIDEIISSILVDTRGTVLSLTDISEPEGISFWQQGNEQDITPKYQGVRVAFDVGGRHWELTMHPTHSYINELGLPSPTRELIGWLIVTCLLALMSFTLQMVISRRLAAHKHQKDIAEAEERTLKKSNALLEEKVLTRTRQLNELGALNRSILMSSSYAIIATDTHGIITVFNPAAERLLGYEAREVIGNQTPSIFHSLEEVQQKAMQLSIELGESIPVGFEVFVCKARQGVLDQNVWTYISKDGGKIPVNLSVTALRDDAGRLIGYLGIAQDLQLQLKRERDLEEAKENALQASKAKSEFLANVSHEIRTPMNGILGLLKILLNDKLPPRQQDFIDKAHQAAVSLLVLLNDILDFSKIEAGKLDIELKPFLLFNLLDDVASLFAPQAEQKNIELIFDISLDLPDEIESDGHRLRQILVNLIGNAIKFTEKGNVIVKASIQPKNISNAYLHIEVVDQGIGMTDEQLQGLFKAFKQADASISRRFGGTGLGLAIVYKLIHLLGGDIHVKSDFGKGSQFYFTVPVVVPLPQVPSCHQFKGTSVLVVEDNLASMVVLQDMLTYLECEVVTAHSAQEAETLLMNSQINGTPIQVAIVDWLLPDINGTELLERIKHNPKILTTPRVILTTSYRNRLLETQIADIESFYLQVLTKPISIRRLSAMLNKVLNDGNEATQQSADLVPFDNLANALDGVKILLVEDNPTNRIVASELLSQYGAVITEAVDGYTALSILKLRSFDIVLMDMQMPGIDGLETTIRIRSELKLTELPIIAMTANASADDKLACKNAGMNDHITKPFEIEPVVILLRNYINTSESQPLASLSSTGTVESELSKELMEFCTSHEVALLASLSRLGGKRLYIKVLEQFAIDVEAAIVQLTSQTLKRTKARNIYHSLRGGASNCGLKNLAHLLQEAESTAINGDTEFVNPPPSLLDALREAQSVIQRISAFFKPEDAKKQHFTINEAEFTELLKEYITSLMNSDMKAVQKFEYLKPYLLQRNSELTAQIEVLMKKLAFKQCLQLIEMTTFAEVNI